MLLILLISFRYDDGIDAKGAIGKVPPTVGLVEPQPVHLPPDRLRFVL